MPKKAPKKDAGAMVAQQDFTLRLTESMQAGRQDGIAIGVCQALEHNITYQKLMKLRMIHQTIKAKEYKAYGLTQAEFFEAIGEKQRNTENIIKELEPILDSFSASFADLAGVKFNKIRLLGQAVSDNLAEIKDGKIEFEGEAYGPKDLPEFLDKVEETYATRLKSEVEKGLEKAVAKELKKVKDDKKALEREVGVLRARHPEDLGTYVSGMRPFIAEAWEDFLAKWRDFVMAGEAELNAEAQEFMVEFYDRIFADLDSVDETRHAKTGNRYTRKKK